MTDRACEGEDELIAALQRYVEERFAQEDDVLVALRQALKDHGFPEIQVSSSTGRLLQLLVAASGGRRVLEVGTLGGYSAIWMGRALARNGRLTSLELDPRHAELARDFVARAGLSESVDVRVGDARELLPRLGPDGSFDVVFLDADKEGYVGYVQEALRLLRPGGLLLADNAFWSGRVLEEAEDDATRGIQAFNEHLARESRLAGTVLPVGDGLAVAVKVG
jgi:predicted O-methyltransferase YrrM